MISQGLCTVHLRLAEPFGVNGEGERVKDGTILVDTGSLRFGLGESIMITDNEGAHCDEYRLLKTQD